MKAIGVIAVFTFFTIVLVIGGMYKFVRGLVTPLAPEIHGVTPAVINVPSYPYGKFSIEAEGAIKVEFPTRCGPALQGPNWGEPVCQARQPGDPENNLVYIPGLGTFMQDLSGRFPGPTRITAISCTAGNWSPTKPGAAADSCLNPITDPQKQVRFTIREVR